MSSYGAYVRFSSLWKRRGLPAEAGSRGQFYICCLQINLHIDFAGMLPLVCFHIRKRYLKSNVKFKKVILLFYFFSRIDESMSGEAEW